jgi:hypothetical protein
MLELHFFSSRAFGQGCLIGVVQGLLVWCVADRCGGTGRSSSWRGSGTVLSGWVSSCRSFCPAVQQQRDDAGNSVIQRVSLTPTKHLFTPVFAYKCLLETFRHNAIESNVLPCFRLFLLLVQRDFEFRCFDVLELVSKRTKDLRLFFSVMRGQPPIPPGFCALSRKRVLASGRT